VNIEILGECLLPKGTMTKVLRKSAFLLLALTALLSGCGGSPAPPPPPTPVPLSISTETLTQGSVQQAYSQQLQATGGTAPYTWSVVSGSLPTGITLSPSGVLSGVPTSSGTFSFTLQVTDSNLQKQQLKISKIIGGAHEVS